jgi:uronate dehydrogenase
MINPATERVLITGAAGAIGTALRNGLRADWRHLRLTDVRPIADPTPNEECIVADISDRAAIERMMEGVAAVVYMTGVGGDYTLEDLFRVNARGMFDVFEAARLAGVQRIVFASSNHAFGCYPIEERVSPALPPRPDSLYGTFKAWGETMLRCYYDRHGIRSVSLRIGTYRTLPIDQRSLATWLSPGDVARLVDAGGQRLFRQHADQDIRSQLGVSRLSSTGQCRGPPRDAARHGCRRGRTVGMAGAWRLARPRTGAAATSLN